MSELATKEAKPHTEAAAKPQSEMTRDQKIAAVITELRPVLQADGGDVELAATLGDKVFVKMSGACVGCQLAAMTMHGIQARMIAALGERVHVLPAELLSRFARE